LSEVDTSSREESEISRLDPLHQSIYFSYLANSYYLAGRYWEALEASRTAVDRLPAVYQAHQARGHSGTRRIGR